jgi:hypothetical protein
VIVDTELLPVFGFSVSSEIRLEIDDLDGLGTNVNEIDDTRDSNPLTVDGQWEIRIILDAQLAVQGVDESLDVSLVIGRWLDGLSKRVSLGKLVRLRPEVSSSPKEFLRVRIELLRWFDFSTA